jgi:hypothetical protein
MNAGKKAGQDLSSGRVVRGGRYDSGLHFFRARFKVVIIVTSQKMKKPLCISALLVLALVGSCFAEPFRIVAYGDSITYGWIPNANQCVSSRMSGVSFAGGSPNHHARNK